MDGPNNLLRHLALEKMWPEQYRALREITEVPYVEVPVQKVKVTEKKVMAVT